MTREKTVDRSQWSGVDLLLLEQQDRKPLKLAITAAVGLHLILFWWNIWPQGKPLPLPTVDDPPFILKKYRLKERPPEKKPLQDTKALKVPFPDPTPHEVEPLFVAVPEPEPVFDHAAVGDDFDDIIPVVEPPPPAAPVRQHLATASPVVLHRVEPEYPRLARISGVEGLVILEAVVRKDGSVGEVTVLMAPEGKLGFDREAVAALRQWRFRPGEMHGRPVDVIMTLTIKFRLDR